MLIKEVEMWFRCILICSNVKLKQQQTVSKLLGRVGKWQSFEYSWRMHYNASMLLIWACKLFHTVWLNIFLLLFIVAWPNPQQISCQFIVLNVVECNYCKFNIRKKLWVKKCQGCSWYAVSDCYGSLWELIIRRKNLP